MPNLKDEYSTLEWKVVTLQGGNFSWPTACVCCGRRNAPFHAINFGVSSTGGGQTVTQRLTVSVPYCDACWRHVNLAKRKVPTLSQRGARAGLTWLWIVAVLSGIGFLLNEQYLWGAGLIVAVIASWWLASRTPWYRKDEADLKQAREKVAAQHEAEVSAALTEQCTAKAHALKVEFGQMYSGNIRLFFANDRYGEAFLEANHRLLTPFF